MVSGALGTAGPALLLLLAPHSSWLASEFLDIAVILSI